MTHDHLPGGDLDVLDDEECWTILESRSIGRFAANRPGASPLVVPINYLVAPDRSSIAFRSGAGAKLNASRQHLVAIQVDEVDPIHHTGWGVAVEGVASWLYEDQDDIDLETWAPGARPYVIRVRPTMVTGRRIRRSLLDTDRRGYQ